MSLLLSHSPGKKEQLLLTAFWQTDQQLMSWQKFIFHIKYFEDNFRKTTVVFLIGECTEVLGSK